MTDAPHDNRDSANSADAGMRRVLALRHLAERALVYGDAHERDVASRLIEVIEGGAEGPLEAGLGLTGPGWMGALRRYRQARRDEALRRIWRENFHDLKATAAAGMIAMTWARCAGSAVRRRAFCPRADPQASLDRLMVAGHEPLAADTIRKILSRDVGHLQTIETPSRTADLD